MLFLYVLGVLFLHIFSQFDFSFILGNRRNRAIHLCAKNGDTAWVRNYLEQGGAPDVKSLDGVTPLYLAAEAGHLDTVKVLVELGADVNLKVESRFYLYDFNPIFVAAWKGHDEIVDFLLNNGAAEDIYFSAVLGDLEALKRYVEAGGDRKCSTL